MNPADWLFLSIPFLIPAAVGLYLLISWPGSLGLMAALLTLKPIVATPIWVAIIQGFSISTDRLQPAHFLSLLPGAGLTLLIVLVFRPLFSGPQAGSALILVAIDCARWLNSFLLILPYGDNSGGILIRCISALLGLALPTVFAVVALRTVLTGRAAERANKTL